MFNLIDILRISFVIIILLVSCGNRGSDMSYDTSDLTLMVEYGMSRKDIEAEISEMDATIVRLRDMRLNLNSTRAKTHLTDAMDKMLDERSELNSALNTARI